MISLEKLKEVLWAPACINETEGKDGSMCALGKIGELGLLTTMENPGYSLAGLNNTGVKDKRYSYGPKQLTGIPYGIENSMFRWHLEATIDGLLSCPSTCFEPECIPYLNSVKEAILAEAPLEDLAREEVSV